MELRHLRYFVAVGQALNFTKAAMRLHLAQPALSRQVSDLEDELGVDLLKRTSHGVLLTPEGKVFLEAARGILQGVDDSVTKVRAHGPSRRASSTAHRADGAIAEIGYALDTLKMDGVTTTTSINDVYLGEPQFDPWLEELNRRGATFFVHPTITKAGETLLNGLNASVIEFMFDTTRMITNMVATGARKRFSQIKIIAAHGGGTIPFLVNRIQMLEHTFGVGPGRLKLSSEEVREGIASFYYDLTAATSEAQLGAILKLVPVSQLLMGLDNPFMPKSTFAPAIADVGRYPAFSETDLRSISYANAFRLYPELAKRIG
jgi:predicted TIM-barrel fold metal-dependent hydrolase